MADPNVLPPAPFQPYDDTFGLTDPQPSLAERMSAVYERLKTAADELNTVSDALGKPIPMIEAALQQLNLGVQAWITFYRDTDDENERGHFRQIGYAKVKGKWGLAIRTLDGFYDDQTAEYWLFGDAPRTYRVEAVECIPELIEQLLADAEKTTADLKKKLDATNQVAAVLVKAATANKAAKK